MISILFYIKDCNFAAYMHHQSKMEEYLIGIDDTDNKESRGTGFLSRLMAQRIAEENLGFHNGITRHQLLFDPRVPYTSQNSSACIALKTNQPNELWDFMIDFLINSCAIGSDCGLCMIKQSSVPQSIVSWGLKAKVDLVNKTLAANLAQKEGVQLIGLTGTHDGIIGAMAGVGLRASGNDGRFVSLPQADIRSITGSHKLGDAKRNIGFEKAVTIQGHEVDDSAFVCFDGGWLRPVLKNGDITIVLNKTEKNGKSIYELASKDFIKSISN